MSGNGWSRWSYTRRLYKISVKDRDRPRSDVQKIMFGRQGRTVAGHSPAGFFAGTIDPKRESGPLLGARVFTLQDHDFCVWQN